MAALSAKAATTPFRIAAGLFLFGPLFLLLSQAIPHDYGFLELGGLFTLSVYDLVLAILGLSIGSAMAETAADLRAIWLTFAAIMLVMLLFFDPIFVFIRTTPLGDVLYLIAPVAVASAGLALWLKGAPRRYAMVAASGLVAFSLSLFIGLDDLGVGIADFASGALFCALWLLVSPGLLLRQFRGPWLIIPSRIIGSWLVVIAIIVTVSLYVPMPVVAPPPPTDGLQSGPLSDGTLLEIPLDDQGVSEDSPPTPEQ
ncbi:hypothetical protein SAMN05880593_14219 [Rhizobium sp. RU36D]|nr:hypothetical protein SAMN05880593_14219 [Rhizobium sp. RU36D]